MPANVGSPAPDFTLKDQNQQDVSLSSFRGKKRVVIVFYPLDWSPVCTKEHACFVNDMKRFDQLDAQVLGLSVDSVWSHKAYAEKMGIHYPLLADFQPRGAVAEEIARPVMPFSDRNTLTATETWHGIKNYDIPVVPGVDEVAKALEGVK